MLLLVLLLWTMVLRETDDVEPADVICKGFVVVTLAVLVVELYFLMNLL